MKKRGKLQLKRRISEFFAQTFRRHTLAEYRAFFVRGTKKTPDAPEDANGRAYPFVYARLLLVLFVAFSAVTFSIWLSGNRISLPSAIALAGLFANLPLCILMYELAPTDDISFPVFLLVLFFGGVVAILLSTLGYYIFSPENEWAHAVYTGFLEEICKGVAAVAAIILLKKRSPYSGFLIGAAVGGGFSIIEDMGYVVYYGGGMYSLSGLVGMAFVRGVCSFGSHIFWTGLVGWAFTKFGFRPKFALVSLGCISLHALWDVPLDFIWAFLIETGCFIAVFLATVFIILSVYDGRKPTEIQLKIPVPEPVNRGAHYALKANVLVASLAVTLSCLALLCVVLPRRFTDDIRYFDDYETLVVYVQEGGNYSVDYNREYDDTGENYGLSVYRGRTISAEQKIDFDGYYCLYRYDFLYDEESGELKDINLSNVLLFIGGEEDYLFTDKIFMPDGTYLSYVVVREGVIGCYFDEAGERFVLTENRRIDHTQNIIIGVIAAAVAAFDATVLVLNSKKSRREQNG